MKVTLKKHTNAAGVSHFLSGASYKGATWLVYVDGLLVGRVRSVGHGGRCGEKGHPVFFGVDGSRDGCVSIRGVFRDRLNASAISIYEAMK